MPGGAASISSINVLSGIARRKMLIAALTLIGLFAGLGLARFLQPVFVAEAQIAIEAAPGQGAVDEGALAGQMSILRSPDLGQRVVMALQLEKRQGFGVAGRTGWFGTIMAKLGLAGDSQKLTPEQRAMARVRGGLAVSPVPDSNVMAVSFAAGDAASAAEVANTLAELYVDQTREAAPPQPMPQPKPAVQARPSLAPEIEAMRKNLAAAEQAVADYLALPRQPQPRPVAQPPVEEISALVARIAIAEAARDEAEARLRAARAFLAVEDPADAAIDAFASLSIERLKEDYSATGLRVADLSLTYLPNHPKLIAAQKELANIGRKLRREVAAVATGLEEQVKAALAREAALRQGLKDLKPKQQEAAPAFDAARLEALQQQAAASRAKLEELLAREAEAQAQPEEPQDVPEAQEAQARPAGPARIVQTAVAPASPVSPRPLPLAAIGGLAGFLLGLSLAFVASLTRGAAAAEEPAPAIAPSLRLDPHHDHGAHAARPPAPAGSPILAAPPMPSAPPLPIEATASVPEPPQPQMEAQYYADPIPEPLPQEPAPRGAEAAPIMTLNPLAALPARLSAAEVTESLSGGQTDPARRLADSAALMAFWAAKARESSASRRFGIMSFGCATGDTSAAAVAMARALSRTKKKTVIIDLCRLGSSLEALLGTAAGPGIADLVSGAAEFTKVMARDSRSPVHLLRYGQDRSEWAMGLVEQNIESVLQALENAYDMLIVHAGEVVKETPGLVRHCHAALVLAPVSRCSDVAVAIDALCTGALRDAQYILVDEHAQSVQAA